jgi:hypothetical protein
MHKNAVVAYPIELLPSAVIVIRILPKDEVFSIASCELRSFGLYFSFPF